MHCYGASPTVKVAHYIGHNSKNIMEDLSVEGAGRLFCHDPNLSPLEYLYGKPLGLLHAKIGELAVANDFLSRRLKPWIGK